MDLLKSTLQLTDNATDLLCDIEKLDYIASGLIDDLEGAEIADHKSFEIAIIKNAASAVNIMFDYINSLKNNIDKAVKESDAIFRYIKEQQSNEQ